LESTSKFDGNWRPCSQLHDFKGSKARDISNEEAGIYSLKLSSDSNGVYRNSVAVLALAVTWNDTTLTATFSVLSANFKRSG
jgi:hypothetical protein